MEDSSLTMHAPTSSGTSKRGRSWGTRWKVKCVLSGWTASSATPRSSPGTIRSLRSVLLLHGPRSFSCRIAAVRTYAHLEACVVDRWSTSAFPTRLKSGIIICVCCWRRTKMKSRMPSRDRKISKLPQCGFVTNTQSSNLIPSSSSAGRYEFFNELYHRFLLTPKVTMKCLCLQALAIVYGRCFEEIGPFADTKYIVGMLDRVSAT